jgi:hypothetical protein
MSAITSSGLADKPVEQGPNLLRSFGEPPLLGRTRHDRRHFGREAIDPLLLEASLNPLGKFSPS